MTSTSTSWEGRRRNPARDLGVYPTAADTMQYERGVLKFPDGQSVKVSEFQAKALIAAAGGNEGKQLARRILEAAGTGESSWTAACGGPILWPANGGLLIGSLTECFWVVELRRTKSCCC